MTAAQIDTRKVEQVIPPRLVERRHDEFVAVGAVQHWLDVTARRKNRRELRDLEPFDKRQDHSKQAQSR